MNTKCPVCQKENNIQPGKYICTDCKSKFEFQSNGKIILIKRNKFDYWTFIMALIAPVVFIGFLIYDLINSSFVYEKWTNLGIILILYPLLLTIRQLFFHVNGLICIQLYFKFFTGKLQLEDSGRIISLYITLVFNAIGFILLFSKILI